MPDIRADLCSQPLWNIRLETHFFENVVEHTSLSPQPLCQMITKSCHFYLLTLSGVRPHIFIAHATTLPRPSSFSIWLAARMNF